jgi:hypothetical protein
MAFGRFNNKVEATVLSHPSCPAIVRTGYEKVKDMMSSMAQQPEPPQE